MTGRRRLLIIGLACVVVAAVAVVAINPFSASPRPVAGSSSATPPSSLPLRATTDAPDMAPSVPAQGAYFGAWVGPADFTQANEIAAVDSLQQQIGRKLAIVHTYVKWQARFPTPSDLTFMGQGNTLLISWAGIATKQIVSGADDSWIRTRAGQIKALGKPVFLEWRWEMDRPNLRSQIGSPTEYVAAWDRIRAIFAAVGVHNAAWVWCPLASGFAVGRAAAYYPGDSEVDWVCADAYPPLGTSASFASTINPFLSWASHHDKPIMIGEFGVPASFGAQQRAQWLYAAAQVVQANRQIKALVYFDADQPGVGPQEAYSLGGDASALSAFRSMARQSYFSPAGTG
jgi:hypothetical protein